MSASSKKIIRAWTFYDWANSAYNLVITATIFPIYYKSVTTLKDTAGNEISNTIDFLGFKVINTALYNWSIALAYLIIASIIPLLSGIADYGGTKKKFMQFFCCLGALSCSAMYLFTSENIGLGIALVILACIGFSGSLVFYNAYLPEIVHESEQDKVSAKGFAMGYLGGAILLILNLIMIMKYELFGIESKGMATRISFLTVGIWWLGFALIPFYYLPNGTKKDKQTGYLTKGYRELRKVWNDLKNNKVLKRFLGAFFIYSTGVQTVMLVATHFGAGEIKMKPEELITTILIIQFIAIAGAHLFSFASGKKGNIFVLKTAALFWALACFIAYFVQTAQQFYGVAVLVGLMMGGIQSLSRSTYSKMLPETNDHASYFSFYDVCEKLSIVTGMVLFGMFTQISGSMRVPIIGLVVFFLVGFILLIRIPKNKLLVNGYK